MNKQSIQQLIIDAMKEAKLKVPQNIIIQTPKDTRWGDYSCSVAMDLAKDLKLSPMDVAKKIATNISSKDLSVDVVQPGFINFKLDKKLYLKELENIISQKDSYGTSDIGKGKTVVIDYSAPNIAKPMSVGHLRSTIIGAALVNILRSEGYKVIGDNHIGDWGTQFGKLLYAYKTWGKKDEDIDIDKMLELYIRFHKEAETNPELEELARAEFKRLEEGDTENRKIWKTFREKSLVDFDSIYKTLGVRFDTTHGESFYEEMLPDIIKKAVAGKLAKKSLGALIIDVGDDMPPLLIQKNDGATLYATRDLATISYREKTYKPAIILYVIGNEQKVYFRQLFEAAKMMKLTDAQMEHIGFGLVRMKEGKMSTRAGRIVYLKDAIDEATKKAYKVVEQKNADLPKEKKKRIAEVVGIGAIKYNDLSQNRNTDILFDYDKMLSLEGNSAPYLMYTYARAKSILRKAGMDHSSHSFVFEKLVLNPSTEKVLKTLGKYSEAVKLAADKYQPNFLCEYLFRLANEFNFFYQENPVIRSEKETKALRLAIVVATAQVIQNGLHLLGLEVLEEM